VGAQGVSGQAWQETAARLGPGRGWDETPAQWAAVVWSFPETPAQESSPAAVVVHPLSAGECVW